MRLNFKKLALLGGHVARGLARDVGLTAARFDFLSVLRVHGPLCQRQIAAKLCCSEAVISRMVRALVALRLVERFVPVRDRRFRVVQLTEEGHKMHAAYDDFEGYSLNDYDDCVQNVGEYQWMNDWQMFKVDGLELGYLAPIGAIEYREPPYELIRMHLRSRPYADPIGVSSQLPQAIPAPPPLEGGLVPDPVLRAPPLPPIGVLDPYLPPWMQAQRQRYSAAAAKVIT